MKRYTTKGFLLIAAVASLGIATMQASAEGQRGLAEIERDVAERFPSVRGIPAEEVRRMQAEREDFLLLDVREVGEFAVSHIPGAQRVDPNITATAFMNRFGAAARNRLIVLYCSVGVRSSRLAERIRVSLTASESKGAVNLIGGIFAWHNTGRELQRSNNGTQYVHPYSSPWKNYLDFDNKARFRPPTQ
jgi:rhodanese-related sulfurtransferase